GKPSAGVAITRSRALSGSAIARPSSSPRSSVSRTCSPAAASTASLAVSTSRPPAETNAAAGPGSAIDFIRADLTRSICSDHPAHVAEALAGGLVLVSHRRIGGALCIASGLAEVVLDAAERRVAAFEGQRAGDG